jgi:alkylation response protein AidB-like acyl-CoA dehydrogenase
MEESNKTLAHVNQYLDDQAWDLHAALVGAREATYAMAEEIDAAPGRTPLVDIMRLRLQGGELCLRAANAAMLHQGAKGYLVRNAAQRRLREAYFVAIVTPATKHLRREIARLEAPQALACAA